MAGTVRETGGDFDYKLMPEGVHAACCDMVVFVGKQLTGFNDEKTGQPKVQEKVYLRFEVPKERLQYKDKQGNEQDRPMTIGLMLTASLNEKATLRKYLEAWRGRQFTVQELEGFDLFNVLGTPCMITVTHKVAGEKTYANITSIAKYQAVMKVGGVEINVDKPVPENTLVRYSEETEEDRASYGELPEWLQGKIDGQVREHPARAENEGGVSSADDITDDDIPF